ncbi:MAG TPA: hypothetical protein VL286_09405 [Rhizomicrobium sp.]|jgi:hypothetical protein|nr:hypothetical protein [Rhizomicrobium sp.]
MKALLVVIGIIAILIGLLWIGQGTGYVMWPRSSFMLQQTQWTWYGAALAVLGLILVLWSRRRI